MDLPLAFESVTPDDGLGSAFVIVFGIAVLVVLAGFAFTAYAMVRNARAARRAGIDPFTPPAVLMAQAIGGGQPRSTEHRLAELDDLHARGVISSEERAAARRAVLET